MCPGGWSPDTGAGMAVPAELGMDVGDGTAVKELKTGLVDIASVTAGEEYPEGVDACSVANRSGVGEEPGLNSPHPRMKRMPIDIHKNLILFMIPTRLIPV